MADRVQEIYQKHPFVYHYTDRPGLEGILSTQTLFATHYRYLNDTSEIQHIQTALIRNLQHILKTLHVCVLGMHIKQIGLMGLLITITYGLEGHHHQIVVLQSVDHRCPHTATGGQTGDDQRINDTPR